MREIKRRYLIILAIVAAGMALLFVIGRLRAKPRLSSQENSKVQFFLDAYRGDNFNDIKESDVKEVAKMGERAVPYLLEAIEEERPKAKFRTQDRAEMISCLARIGTRKAIDGICMILEEGLGRREGNLIAVMQDRHTGAQALVLLGAKDRAPLLEQLIADQKELEEYVKSGEAAAFGMALIEEQETPLSEKLARAYEMLTGGEGQGEIDGLAWTTAADGRRIKGKRDFLK